MSIQVCRPPKPKAKKRVNKPYTRPCPTASFSPLAGRFRVKALVTNRVGEGVAFMPFHFAGFWEGESQRGNYPEGTDPIVLGDSANAVTTYGYDPVTAMHEGKATLCRIEAA